MQVLTHDKIEQINSGGCLVCHNLLVLCLAYLQEVIFFIIVLVTMKHDPFEAL
jgi:hypothetical protein